MPQKPQNVIDLCSGGLQQPGWLIPFWHAQSGRFRHKVGERAANSEMCICQDSAAAPKMVASLLAFAEPNLQKESLKGVKTPRTCEPQVNKCKGTIIGSASYDGTVRLWSVAGKCLKVLEGTGSGGGEGVGADGKTAWAPPILTPPIRISPGRQQAALHEAEARVGFTETLSLRKGCCSFSRKSTGGPDSDMARAKASERGSGASPH